MAGPNTLEFTEANFDAQVLQANEPVLVDFWAEWCAPCKALTPVIDDLAKDYAGRARIGKVDLDSNQTLAARYSVSNIPTVALFNKGKLVEKLVGLRPKKDFQLALDKMLTAE